MYGDLKLTFIEKVLQDYLTDVQAGMAILIRRNKSIKSQQLLNSLDDIISGTAGTQTGELIFKEYGRMIDMGVGRGHPLGGVKATRIALQASNGGGTVLDGKKSTRKRKIIYSRIAYGKLNHLENQLLYGFTQETIELLKKEMN